MVIFVSNGSHLTKKESRRNNISVEWLWEKFAIELTQDEYRIIKRPQKNGDNDSIMSKNSWLTREISHLLRGILNSERGSGTESPFEGLSALAILELLPSASLNLFSCASSRLRWTNRGIRDAMLWFDSLYRSYGNTCIPAVSVDGDDVLSEDAITWAPASDQVCLLDGIHAFRVEESATLFWFIRDAVIPVLHKFEVLKLLHLRRDRTFPRSFKQLVLTQ